MTFNFEALKHIGMLNAEGISFYLLKFAYILSENRYTKAAFIWSHLGPLSASSLFSFEFISTELSSYLTSHPNIEVLSVAYSNRSILCTASGALPRLKPLMTDIGLEANSIVDSTTLHPALWNILRVHHSVMSFWIALSSVVVP